MEREQWGSRIGMVLAIAGGAVGLGNFLRFPVQMAGNGGGAFMVPYFIAFVLLGIPLLWLELTMGRFGGALGHGTTPGMFDKIVKRPSAKYFGVFGLLLPLIVVIYYVYIESWTLGYSYFSLTGAYKDVSNASMGEFLSGYQGIMHNEYFSGIGTAYLFFIITFIVNMYVLLGGVKKGIETLARVGMPLLFIMAIIMVIKVLALGTPDPAKPDWNVVNGLAFIWTPKLSELSSPSVWLAAAGQIFFTLSVGFGAIQTYSSYLQHDEDIALSGLATASTNEFIEVVLGSTIAIPISVAFFGSEATAEIARSGSFNLAFQVLPNIFKVMPGGFFFGFVWFFLLFIAGITSSVLLCQPVIAFLKDEFKMSQRKAVIAVGTIVFVAVQPVIFFLSKGFLDELDFWAGTFLLVIFALIECLVMTWFFGMDKTWKELNKGADIKIPRIFYYIIKYVTPIYLLIILVAWAKQDAIKVFFMKGVSSENVPYVLAARFFIFAIFVGLCILVYASWKKNSKNKKGEQ